MSQFCDRVSQQVTVLADYWTWAWFLYMHLFGVWPILIVCAPMAFHDPWVNSNGQKVQRVFITEQFLTVNSGSKITLHKHFSDENHALIFWIDFILVAVALTYKLVGRTPRRSWGGFWGFWEVQIAHENAGQCFVSRMFRYAWVYV